MSQKYIRHFADKKYSFIEEAGGLVVFAGGAGTPSGLSLPAAGFKPGCIFIDETNANVYKNSGSATAATWVQLNSGGGLTTPQINTAISTIGAGTLTAAAIIGGVVTRSGSVAAYTDTTDTAAIIIAALPAGTPVGTSWPMFVRNTVAFNETIAGGNNVTLSGNTIVPPNSVGQFLVTYATATTVTILGVDTDPLTNTPLTANTNITTVGAGTLTGAAIAGGVITRSGSIAAYSDATDTGAAIIAALPNANVGQAQLLYVKNTVAFAETITAGDGNVTLSGQTVIPPNSFGVFLVSVATATTVTIRGLAVGPLASAPPAANTAISTAGAGTLTGAAIVGGVITRTGPSAAYNDTVDIATNIIAALPSPNIGQSWYLTIKNTVAFAETIVTAAGVTLSGQVIIPPNSVGTFLVTYNGAGTVTIQGLEIAPMTTPPLVTATNLTTAGAGTVTAAGIAGGVTNRTGATVAYTDTLDTTANIIAALPNANVGQSFWWTYYNNTLGNCTLAAGDGSTTITGTGIPLNQWAAYLITVVTSTTITVKQFEMGPNVALPFSRFTVGTAATLNAGDASGAAVTHYENNASNATVTLRTATQMFADIPNCQIGFTYTLNIRNLNATGLTVAAPDGNTTLSGTMTIAQNTTRTFAVQFTAATTMTITSMGIGAAAV